MIQAADATKAPIAPHGEFSSRLERLREAMDAEGLDAMLVFSDEYRYAGVRYLADFRPCTLNAYGGLYTPALVLVAGDAEPVLYVPDNELPFASGVSTIGDVRAWKRELLSDLKELVVGRGVHTMGIDGLEVMPTSVYDQIAEATSGADLRRAPLIARLRTVKSPWEIEMLSEAALAHDQGMAEVFASLEEGMTEWEIAARADSAMRRQGFYSTVPTLVGIGPNAADGGSELLKPSWETRRNRRLREGDAVVIDITAAGPQGYCSDLCRATVFGAGDPQYRAIAEAAVTAIGQAMAAAVVGATAGQIESASHQSVASAGYGEFFKHEAFHGIGLEVEEAPFALNTVLEENMCLSIESGIYLPDVHGIRLEDVIVIEAGGPRLLNSFPRELAAG